MSKAIELLLRAVPFVQAAKERTDFELECPSCERHWSSLGQLCAEGCERAAWLLDAAKLLDEVEKGRKAENDGAG